MIGDRGFPLPMFRRILWEDIAISTGEVTFSLFVVVKSLYELLLLLLLNPACALASV